MTTIPPLAAGPQTTIPTIEQRTPPATAATVLREAVRDPRWKDFADDGAAPAAMPIAPARTSLKPPTLAADLVGFKPSFIEIHHGSMLIKGKASGRVVSLSYDKDIDQWITRADGRRRTMSPAEKTAAALALEVFADIGDVDEEDARAYAYAAAELRPKAMTLLQFRTLAYDLSNHIGRHPEVSAAAIDALQGFVELVR